MVITMNELRGEEVEAICDFLLRKPVGGLSSFGSKNVVLQYGDRYAEHSPLPEVRPKDRAQVSGSAVALAPT